MEREAVQTVFRSIKATEEPQRITMEYTTLISSAVLSSALGTNAPTSVVVSYATGEEALLCTLTPGVMESLTFNLLIMGGETVIIRTTNGNNVFLNCRCSQIECPYKEIQPSLRLITLGEEDKAIVAGPVTYSTATISKGEGKRISLCALINGSEITITNLIPGKINSTEISIELSEGEVMELFTVGKGSIDLVGFVQPEEEESEEEEEWESEEGEGEEEEKKEWIDGDKLLSLIEEREGEKREREGKEKKKSKTKKEEKRNLKITELKKSSSPRVCKVGDEVKIHFKGSLTNNEVFDSSSPKGFVFRVGDNKVIKGLEMGVEGMNVGSKRKLVIRPPLGYGSKAMGRIPADSTLIFEVELTDILTSTSKKGKNK